MGNVENAISEPLDFKIFLEEHAPRLPYKPCTFATHFLVTPLKKYALDAVPDSGVQDSPSCVSIPMG